MNDIAIYGAGGFGKEVALLIEQINAYKRQWNLIGYFDDGHDSGSIINGLPVIGAMNDLLNYSRELSIVIAIGNPHKRKEVGDTLATSSLKMPTLIHPMVQIPHKYVRIGKGCVITAGNIVTVNIDIGDFVILNLACTVGHDSTIGNYCSIMPGVNISGEVIINDLVYIGTGAKVINQVEIGEKATVGAGAVVVRSLPAHCTAVGVPAKPIKS